MNLFNRKPTAYESKQRCTNCDRETIIIVPVGTSIKEFIRSGNAVCQFCGCSIVKIVRGLPPTPSPSFVKESSTSISRKRGRPSKKKPLKAKQEPEPVEEEPEEEDNDFLEPSGEYNIDDEGVKIEAW